MQEKIKFKSFKNLNTIKFIKMPNEIIFSAFDIIKNAFN